ADSNDPVRRDRAMYQTLSMQVAQGIERGLEHVACVGFRERSMLECGGQIVIRVLEGGVNMVLARDFRTARIAKFEDMRMAEMARTLPRRKDAVGIRMLFGYDFQQRSLAACERRGKECSAILTTQPLLHRVVSGQRHTLPQLFEFDHRIFQ